MLSAYGRLDSKIYSKVYWKVYGFLVGVANLRVLFLSHDYPPFTFGGIGAFVKNLSEGLAALGVDVSVFCGYSSHRGLNHGDISVTKCNNNLTLYRFPIPELPPRHTWFQVMNFKRIYRLAKKINPDVIHGQSGSTFPASISLKNISPLLVTFHSSPKVEMTLSLNSLRRGGSLGDIWTYSIGYPAYTFTFRRELKSASISVAVSKSLQSELIDEMGWKYQKRLRVIPNGINLKQLDSEYSFSGNEEEESANNIIFAGRLYWRKGAMELIHLAHLMKRHNLDSKIVVYGKGPLFDKIKHIIPQLGLNNITLKGFTDRLQLMRGLRTCKFVLIPSFYEACPMILLEAMCLGKIPLMFNLPFSSEFTENGRFGVLAENAYDLIHKLENLSAEVDLVTFSTKMKNFARQQYDIQKTSLSYIELYKEINNKN